MLKAVTTGLAPPPAAGVSSPGCLGPSGPVLWYFCASAVGVYGLGHSWQLLSFSGHCQESVTSTGPASCCLLSVCCHKQIQGEHPGTENAQISFRLFLETEILETGFWPRGRGII